MTTSKTIEELVRNSGNSFHAKVARWLSDDGWHVVVSPYYLDQTQNKAREIDLVAEKLWPISDTWGKPLTNLCVRLYVECKYIPTPTVFWFTDKDLVAALELTCQNGVFRRNNTYTEKHHYLALSRRVAKVFTSSQSRSPENDPIYKALNQALNAQVTMRGSPVSIPASGRSEHRIHSVLEYPVIVCNSFDDFYSVDFFADSSPEKIDENFQLEVRYAYIDRSGTARDDYFLIDIVDFKSLETFSTAITKGAEAGAFLASPD